MEKASPCLRWLYLLILVAGESIMQRQGNQSSFIQMVKLGIIFQKLYYYFCQLIVENAFWAAGFETFKFSGFHISSNRRIIRDTSEISQTITHFDKSRYGVFIRFAGIRRDDLTLAENFLRPSLCQSRSQEEQNH